MTWCNLVLVRRQSPEIYNPVFQYHTQPLLDVFKALLLIHYHCSQPVWPMKIAPTNVNPAATPKSNVYNPLSKPPNLWLTAFTPQGTDWVIFFSFSWVPSSVTHWKNDHVSPVFTLNQWIFGLLFLSKLEYACSFRGSTGIWALGALWGF